MWVYENLGPILVLAFAAGMGLHFLKRWLERRAYLRLREDCVDAVRDARGGSPEAIVREAELMRELNSSRLPSWLGGLGRHARRWAMYCAALALLVLLARKSGPGGTGGPGSRINGSTARVHPH